jgi:hypothetical protein
MDTKLAPQPRPGRGFSLVDETERMWWDMPWWARTPAFFGVLWLLLAGSFLVAFCMVVDGIAERSHARQWELSEQARQEWMCASSRNRNADINCGALVQVSHKD